MHLPRLLNNKCVFMLLLLTSVFMTASFAPNVSFAEHEGKVQILLLGDSTAEGSIPRALKPAGPHLEQLIEQLLAAEGDLPACHVINTSLSGEYIQRLVESGRYDRVASKLPGIDYIFIRYGLNDRGRVENFKENFPRQFHELIARLRKDHPNAKIIPMTVIPYFDEAGSKDVNDLVRQVAEKEGLPVFDIYPAYAAALKAQGPNSLNYRRFPVNQIPEKYRPLVQPYVRGDRVVVMDNELDSLFGHLPGWYGDRHPNLAGYNVIAVETSKYMAELLRAKKAAATK